MKHITYAIVSIAFFFLMLCFPKETLSGATNGLLLWFQTVLPTLLPFFVLTNFMIQTNSIFYISRLCGSLLQRLFCVSPAGSFAVLSGLLCGYPIGAKVTADLVRAKHISLQEGKYLLSFCNNTSPAFITSFIVLQNFKEESLLFPTLIILYASPVLCSFIFRKFYHISRSNMIQNSVPHTQMNFRFEIFDNCIMNAFENITKIGGYIILFSILFSFGEALPLQYILPSLEITNGVPYIIKNVPSFELSYIFILVLASFGGFCSIAQTNSTLSGTKLSVFSYTIEKLITALVTSLFALLYVLIIHQ